MDIDNRRTTKEYNLKDDGHTKIKSKYGTLDKNNPEILYIRSRATITPVIKKKDFSENIISIKKHFEKNVKNIIYSSNNFEDKYICSIEMSENGISFNKKSHVKYDIYVKPKNNKNLEDYSNDIQTLTYQFNQTLANLFTENNIKIE
jgi:hypothetical protein